MNSIQYAAFLRGINSTGNPPVKMDVLRTLFERLGFENVRTIIGSGNVLFTTSAPDEDDLEHKIEEALPRVIGFESDVFIRLIDDLKKIEFLDPYRSVESTAHTKFYATFVKRKAKTDLEYPIEGKGFAIIGVYYDVVCSVVDLAHAKTPHIMQILERKLGNCITTRNWSTIARVLEASKKV